MRDEHISTALELIRHHYEGGGKTPMLLEDRAGWLARKGQQLADLPGNAAEAWENYRNNPIVTAFREEPGKMIPGAAKIFGEWAAENPFAAARKVAGTYADFTGNPHVAIPNAFLSSSPLNEGEDEIARQIEYGIRPETDYPGKERYTLPDAFARGGYASGGDIVAKALAALRGGQKIFPKPQRMFPEGARPPGGEYINTTTGEAVTGQKPARAVLGVTPEGKPVFMTDTEQVDVTGSPGKGSTKTMTNLFRRSAGWDWKDAPEGYENVPMIVSTENRKQHYYSLGADYPKGVDLARYPNEASEPRLKPTTQGNVYPGEQVGTLLNKKTGDEHPVYDMVTIRNMLAGTGAGMAGVAAMPEEEPQFARGGPVREHHASGNRVLGALISGAEHGGAGNLTNLAKQILKQSPESNLYQEILQNRGIDAARRVQRAADEIPNLGSMYTPNALREAFTGINGDESLLMSMKPSDFGKFAAPIGEDLKNWKAGSPEAWDKYVNELTKVPQSGGFSEVPYLVYGEPDRVPAIVGHEGRHRSLALEQMDVPNSLVRLQPNFIVKDAIQSPILENNPGWRPYKDEKFKMQFQQRLPEDLKVVPETKSLDDFQKLELPEPFAHGGHVNNMGYINQLLERLGITPQDALELVRRHTGGRPEDLARSPYNE